MSANLDRLFWQYEGERERIKRAPKPSTIPAGFISGYTRVQNHEVHSLTGGRDSDRLPVLMLHGALASRRYLMPTAQKMAEHRRIFVPEMPGHGASSNPPHALSVKQQAAVLAEWCHKNALTRFDMFANSYGCQVAAQLTADHPEMINTLSLTGPTCDPSAPTLAAQAYRLYQDGKYEPHGSQRQLFEDLYDMSIHLAFETCRQMMADDITQKLPHIECPTMVLRGSHDTVSPQPWNEHLAGMLKNVTVKVIESAPHCVNYAAAEKLT